ncbi:MAG: MCP four helix bundle domain-containing protein [Bryobacteraceae bacterium]|nr:MCP four helix bundle domain-containing protein [Bryobacteraceae bacterium]
MNNITIGNRIAVACSVLVLFTIAIGGVSMWNIRQINANTTALANDSVPGLFRSGMIMGFIKEGKVARLIHIASDTPEAMTQAEASIVDLENKLQSEMKQYEQTITTPADRQAFATLMNAHQRFNLAWTKIQPISRELKTKEALEMWTKEATPIALERATAMDALSKLNKDSADVNSAAALASGTSANFWASLILGIAAVSGALLAFFIVRSINTVLRQTAEELGNSGVQLASASGQVSSSSQSLSQGASEQAASLEQISASLEQVGAMTRKNSENSSSAATMMAQTIGQVGRSNEALNDMVASMSAMKSSSQKVAKIITTIDEIAFQTNILALNAAVEAARAGEAGMGFAVVADEVRNLAQRSAAAAKDTALLIEGSISSSNESAEKLARVTAAISLITGSISEVRILVDEVSEASRQQTQGIGQVSQAITQVSTVTQTSAANAEEGAAASEELTAQAQSLHQLVHNLQTLVGGASKYRSGTVNPTETPRRRHAPVIGRPVNTPKRSARAAVLEDEFPMETKSEGSFRSF